MRLVAPAVACIGNGHPVVRGAIKEKSISSLVSDCLIFWGPDTGLRVARAQAYTIYSCRTSILKLAQGKELSSLMASLLGCVCSALARGAIKINSCSGSEAVEGALKLSRQACIRFGIVGCGFDVLSSTGMNRSSPKAKRKSFLGTFPTGHSYYTFLGTSTKCHQPTRSASVTRKKPRSSTWKGSTRNSRTSFSSLDTAWTRYRHKM